MSNKTISENRQGDAIFYMDLLQVCALLNFGDEDLFSRADVYKYGGTAVHLGHHLFVGLEQAIALFAEVYGSEAFVSGEVARHLAINPLFRHLEIDPGTLSAMHAPPAKLDALQEGSYVPTETHYLSFETSPLMMALAALSVDRICEFQGHVATDTLEQLQQVRESLDGLEMPEFVNMGSLRQYTTTLAAYFARSRHLGGVERFLDPRLRERSEPYAARTRRPEWQLKSHDVIRRITDEEHRLQLTKRYGDETAKELDANGIAWLKEEDYLDYGLFAFVLDGEIANTVRSNPYFSITVVQEGGTAGTGATEEGFVMDTSYQAIWNPPDLGSTSALYGRDGKSLAVPLRAFQANDATRAKWSRIPKLLVHDVRELEDVVQAVQEAYPGRQVYFRGQNAHFSLRRAASVNELLYGDCTVDELSLPTAASRHRFDFDSFMARFQLQLQGLLYAQIGREQFTDLRPNWDHWGPRSPFSAPEVSELYEKWFRLFYSYEWDLLAMALAQHYGIPTHGLDITNELNIALWFSLHRWYGYRKENRECCWYRAAERVQRTKIDEYPVLYILATDNDLKRDLDQVEYAGIPALRPVRQHAFLHYGGWGMHTNICAEDVVVAAFLSERFSAPDLPSISWLFPSEKEDLFYGELLELKRRAMDAGLTWGYEHIAEYQAE